jgi:hypothetical protein
MKDFFPRLLVATGRRRASIVALAMLLSGTPLPAQFLIDRSVDIPLYHTNVPGIGPKVGIYLSLGGGMSPQFFTFDTGGHGFAAAYSDSSPWWGTNFTRNTNEQGAYIEATNAYASGDKLLGIATSTRVSFFHGPDATVPLLTSPRVYVNQATNITYDGKTTWPSEGSSNAPYVKSFYGDFGMGLASNQNGIGNIISQMSFGAGITRGFRISIHTNGESVLRIGLTTNDTQSPNASYFRMNRDSNGAYDNQLLSGTLSVSNGESSFVVTNVRVAVDTGGGPHPIIFYDSNHPVPLDSSLLTNINGQEYLASGTSFDVLLHHATNGTSNGFPLYDFTVSTTSPTNKVSVNGFSYPYLYVNTGIEPFTKYDVIYDLSAGVMGFDSLKLVTTSGSVPEASPLHFSLTGLALMCASWLLIRRNRSKGPVLQRSSAS